MLKRVAGRVKIGLSAAQDSRLRKWSPPRVACVGGDNGQSRGVSLSERPANSLLSTALRAVGLLIRGSQVQILSGALAWDLVRRCPPLEHSARTTDNSDVWRDIPTSVGIISVTLIECGTSSTPTSSTRYQCTHHATRHEGTPSQSRLRVLFAFDPRRTAILLVGGDKSPDDPSSPNWNRWYTQFVPVADDLYDNHLANFETRG